MKKAILSCFVFGVFLSGIFAFDISSFSDMKTNAKGMTRTNYSIISKFGEYYRTPSSKIVYKFNSINQVTESSELDAHGNLENKLVNTYDSMGNLTNQSCFDAENNQIWNSTVLYNNGKKMECSEWTTAGNLKGKTIYTYSNNSTDESYYNGEGELVWKIISEVNEKNQKIKEYEYFADGSVDEMRQFAYSASGVLDTISYFNDKNELTEKDVFRYDGKGVLTEVTTYCGSGKVTERTIAKYDNIGNLQKLTVYKIQSKFGTTQNEMVDMAEFSYEY